MFQVYEGLLMACGAKQGPCCTSIPKPWVRNAILHVQGAEPVLQGCLIYQTKLQNGEKLLIPCLKFFRTPGKGVVAKIIFFPGLGIFVHILGNFAGQAWVKVCMMAL